MAPHPQCDGQRAPRPPPPPAEQAVLEMALTPAPSAQTLFGIDKDSQELVVYDTKDSATLLKVEKDTLKGCRSLTLAADLVDTRVYVCTPQVLIEFDSNFDFHTMEQLLSEGAYLNGQRP